MADFSKSRGVDAMAPVGGGGSGGGGNFAPSIRWREDGEQKYIVFLNPIENLSTVYLHEWVPVGTHPSGKTKYGFFVDRRDVVIGEDSDELTDRLGQVSKRRTLAVAVELEPKFTLVNGKNRPTGFEVKTGTYERENDSGVTEEVEFPQIGVVSQAWKNFFGYLASYDQTNTNIEDTAFQIVRRGKGSDTVYDHVPFAGVAIDYDKLFNNIAAVGYVADITIDDADDAPPRNVQLGNYMLDKYLDELADKESYDTLVGPIEYLDPPKYGGGKNTPKQAETAPQQEATTPSEPTESKADRLRARYAAQTQ